jgi:hypothetical protein
VLDKLYGSVGRSAYTGKPFNQHPNNSFFRCFSSSPALFGGGDILHTNSAYFTMKKKKELCGEYLDFKLSPEDEKLIDRSDFVGIKTLDEKVSFNF